MTSPLRTKGETEAQREVETPKSQYGQKQYECQKLSPLKNNLIISSNHSLLLASSAHPKLGYQNYSKESSKDTRWQGKAFLAGNSLTKAEMGAQRLTVEQILHDQVGAGCLECPGICKGPCGPGITCYQKQLQ